ncbi:Secreted RxLR effector peptide protein [Phytophthora palmivora]|uniref:RxLR effector protein n=1 Tax=Phytophthora palmivora TaxID=4796 RepID=A0A2P4XZQ1_9STRA|nr:Secreted RxLR effector peptide protein [Phytophthora palmivora]
MRLSSILLAAGVLTLFASGNALPTVTVADSTEVSNMAAADTGLSNERLNNGDGKRFLRGEVNDDDEERLSGANMFKAEKIEQAIGDASYAKTLFQRWKRNGVDSDGAFKKLRVMHNLDTDKKVYKLYLNYRAWLEKHHPLGQNLGMKNMFDEAKISKAAKDPTYANNLFGRWKRNNFDMIKVRDQFKTMRITSENPLYNVYKGYVAWLRIHHPKEGTAKLTSMDFLFERTRLGRTLVDETFANKLFAKWKSRNYNSDYVFKKFQAMGVKYDKELYQVYLKYHAWLEKYHPLPPL